MQEIYDGGGGDSCKKKKSENFTYLFHKLSNTFAHCIIINLYLVMAFLTRDERSQNLTIS